MLITIETGMEGWEMAGSLRKTVPCTANASSVVSNCNNMRFIHAGTEIPVLSNVCSTHAKNAYKQYHAQLTPLRMIRNFPLRKCHRKRTKSRNKFCGLLSKAYFYFCLFFFQHWFASAFSRADIHNWTRHNCRHHYWYYLCPSRRCIIYPNSQNARWVDNGDIDQQKGPSAVKTATPRNVTSI